MMHTITEPGVYDMPNDVYHADPVDGGSLTSTGARRLLAVPPARWRYERDNPGGPSDEMEIGTAAHSLILGSGPGIAVIEARDWRTKAAREEAEQARRDGMVPLLRHDADRVSAMRAAIGGYEVAGALLDPERGRPEQTMIWRDTDHGVWRRAMVDHLPHRGNGRPILVDYKTTRDASLEAIAKAVANYGYHQQAAWYLDGWRALFGDDDPAFLFLFQEKEPPYLVQAVELDDEALIVGYARNRRALEIYAACRASGDWPGHSPEIELVSLPRWATRTEVYQ